MIGNLISYIFDIFRLINVEIVTFIYNVTNFKDTTILLIVTFLITITPIVYLLITKFTVNYSFKRIVFLIIFFSVFISSSTYSSKMSLTFLENLTKQTEAAATFALVLTLFFCITAILQDSFFSNLFNRYED